AMGHLIERMQRELVASGNRLDERRPGPLRDRSLGVGIEHVAQRCRRSLWTLLGHDGRIRNSPTFLPLSAGQSKIGDRFTYPWGSGRSSAGRRADRVSTPLYKPAARPGSFIRSLLRRERASG